MNRKENAISDSEYCVIGGLIIDNSQLNEIQLDSDDFTNENLGIIFDAIESLINNRQPADVITLAEYLNNRTKRNWLQIISNAVENTPGSTNTKAYAKIIRKNSIKRKAENIGIKLQNEIWTNENIIDEIMRELFALNQGKKSYECSVSKAVTLALEFLDEQNSNDNNIVGISTGLIDLDNMLGGYHKTDLITIGGRPSQGKTAFMINGIERINVPTGIITSEQGRIQIAQRLIMLNGKINSFRMRTGKLDESDWKNIIESASRLQKMKSWLYDKPSPSAFDIARQARKWHFHHDIKILFIDYIQRIKDDWKKPRHEQIDNICKTLKNIARELEIPIVALAQINRDVEKRPDKRPRMGDFKESGAIEQESDIMITLYRDEIYNSQTIDKDIAEITTCKNRHGPIGTIKTNWIGQYMMFENITDQDSGY